MSNTFNQQLEIVRETNRRKYEIKLMHEEEEFSKKSELMFLEKKEERRRIEKEGRRIKKREEELIMEQILIQEQLENEMKELEIFTNEYIINKLNKNNSLNIEHLREEAEKIFYERLLKKQQDEEYERAIMKDKLYIS